MALDVWINGIADLVVRAPNVLTRLGEPNWDLAKERRFYWDYIAELQDDATALSDVGISRPFWVVTEVDLVWEGEGPELLIAEPVYFVGYSEATKYPDDHKASREYFGKLFGEMLEFCAERQGRPFADAPDQTHLPVRRIQMIDPPLRSPRNQRDPNRLAETDHFSAGALFTIGEQR